MADESQGGDFTIRMRGKVEGGVVILYTKPTIETL